MDPRSSQAHWDHAAALDDFLDLLTAVSAADARAMVAAWSEIDPAERSAAWALARSEAKVSHRERGLDDAREATLHWASESNHILEGSPYSVTYGNDLTKRDARVQAVAPVLDAAVASILRDRLPREAFEVLYGPFAVAIAPADDDDRPLEDEAMEFDAPDGAADPDPRADEDP